MVFGGAPLGSAHAPHPLPDRRRRGRHAPGRLLLGQRRHDSPPSPSTSASPGESGSGTPAGVGIAGGRDADDDVADECAAGVGVQIDVGDLDEDREDAVEDAISAIEGAWCISAQTPITAREALDLIGVSTEGTTEYGDAVICRVDGVPAADLEIANPEGGSYTEECAGMPAAFAYWGMWVKTVNGPWDYAQEGVDTQPLEQGEQLELLFTLNGEPTSPDGGSAG
ncbi:hypothetical protein [Litorihabitans aurantiacus]|uniref:DUF4430 domain-containing protein n=1 Tax=Litorihabitans aurantiacus TaxID=1930061 RepID=A0AA37XF90_9MICO|nr:hypothetical protein [Litorihabitans aurantiacus]GMA31927.1 hypothetical protein GCM10025875_19190 [Litorihabitans aurantiacus]